MYLKLLRNNLTRVATYRSKHLGNRYFCTAKTNTALMREDLKLSKSFLEKKMHKRERK